jgi:hypothetical protein
MTLKDPEKRRIYERSRYEKRREYWKLYQRKRRKNYIPKHIEVPQSLGVIGEREAITILNASYAKNRQVDLDWQGKRVEVKTAIKRTMTIRDNIYNRKYHGHTFFWKFYLKQKDYADLFFFVLKNESGYTEWILLIPSCDLKVKHFRIAESKIHNYDKYMISF